MPLAIERYNGNELFAMDQLSPRVIQAFSPITFQALGYPTRVASEKHIFHFADTMHEEMDIIDALMAENNLISRAEADLLAEVSARIGALIERETGTLKRPWSAMLQALNMFRVVNALSEIAGEKLSVFEVGPGSGCLGALLIHAGHRYISTDVTQSLYLWQSRLFEFMSEGDFTEFAEFDTPEKELSDPGTPVVHMPWWTYGSFYMRENPFKAGVVVVDHALGEMHNHGMNYLLRAARDMLDGPGMRILACTSLGLEQFSDMGGLLPRVYRMGFLPVTYRRVQTYAPITSVMAKFGIPPQSAVAEFENPGSYTRPHHSILELDERTMHYTTAGGHALVKAADAFPLDWETASVDYPFIYYLSGRDTGET